MVLFSSWLPVKKEQQSGDVSIEATQVKRVARKTID
jgi:hypothetical protein